MFFLGQSTKSRGPSSLANDEDVLQSGVEGMALGVLNRRFMVVPSSKSRSWWTELQFHLGLW